VTIKSVFKLVSKILSPKEKKRLGRYFVRFLLLGILEIIGIGSLALFSYLYLAENEKFTFQLLNHVYGRSTIINASIVIALFTFLAKNLLGIWFTRSFFIALGRIEKRIAMDSLEKSLRLPPRQLANLTDKFLSRALTDEVSFFVSGVIGYLILGISELIIFMILLLTVVIFFPFVIIGLIVGVSISAFVLNKYISPLTLESGQKVASARTESVQTIKNLGIASKTLWVGPYPRSIISFLSKRFETASYGNAMLHFTQQMNKYMVEFILLATVIPTVLAVNYFSNSKSPVAVLSILLAVSFRILPTLMRVQGSILAIKGAFGNSKNFIEITSSILDETLGGPVKVLEQRDTSNQGQTEEKYLLKGKGIEFEYGGGTDNLNVIFKNLNFEVPRQALTGIVGESGVGKTTLVDLILGIIKPQKGELVFASTVGSNIKISYMSQIVPIFSLTIIENVALGIPQSEIDIDLARSLLRRVGLSHLESSLPSGFETALESQSDFLSGGEVQRLGIARALYSQPVLLVLDEPTSSLDVANEINIIEILREIKKSCTIVAISHNRNFQLSCDHLIEL